MPMWVIESGSRGTPRGVGKRRGREAGRALPELVPRSCKLQGYTDKPVPSLRISSDVIAYTSPDSTFAVTKMLFDKAKKSILIGIYDFSAPYMRQLLLDAMARKVKVSIMLDIDSQAEQSLFNDLLQMGATGVNAPSCANKHVRVFRSSHEKVIVIDDTWTLVQSGNYTEHSIPLNVVDGGEKQNFRTGNRDTGLAVRSAPMARFFTEILTADMALVPAAPEMLAQLPREAAFLVEKTPTKLPSTLFPSKHLALVTLPWVR